jgi:threonine aldolase
MNFCSDNVSPVAPEIMAALLSANQGAAMPYGHDDYTQRLNSRFAELFETNVTVFPVATGTAANALALACLTPVYGAIYCHAQAHIYEDECGAPEFYTGGAKLVPLPGNHGKLNPEILRQTPMGAGVVHQVQPAAVSLTQATEAGTVYTVAEVAAIAEVARAKQLFLHVDGARFANALVHLGCTPAQITWQAGVDVLCFGATKNGAMAAEAVVFFNSDLAQAFQFRRKRGGHLWSKLRFLSVQLEAYLEDNLWLKQASHANALAQKLAQGLIHLPGVNLCHPVEANEVFVELPESLIVALEQAGVQFYRWPDDDSQMIRLVTGFNTSEQEVRAFLALAKQHSLLPV